MITRIDHESIDNDITKCSLMSWDYCEDDFSQPNYINDNQKNVSFTA